MGGDLQEKSHMVKERGGARGKHFSKTVPQRGGEGEGREGRELKCEKGMRGTEHWKRLKERGLMINSSVDLPPKKLSES